MTTSQKLKFNRSHHGPTMASICHPSNTIFYWLCLLGLAAFTFGQGPPSPDLSLLSQHTVSGCQNRISQIRQLKNRNLLSLSSGSQDREVGRFYFSWEVSLLGLQMTVFLLCPGMAFPLHASLGTPPVSNPFLLWTPVRM